MTEHPHHLPTDPTMWIPANIADNEMAWRARLPHATGVWHKASRMVITAKQPRDNLR